MVATTSSFICDCCWWGWAFWIPERSYVQAFTFRRLRHGAPTELAVCMTLRLNVLTLAFWWDRSCTKAPITTCCSTHLWILTAWLIICGEWSYKKTQGTKHIHAWILASEYIILITKYLIKRLIKKFNFIHWSKLEWPSLTRMKLWMEEDEYLSVSSVSAVVLVLVAATNTRKKVSISIDSLDDAWGFILYLQEILQQHPLDNL